MAVITFKEAVRAAMEEEMVRDESVFLMGEDVVVTAVLFLRFAGDDQQVRS